MESIAETHDTAEASQKRHRKISDASKERVKREYGLDGVSILQCPICSKRFSPSVFQCQNGHTACSVCCKGVLSEGCPTCTLPLTGSIRCIAIEKILEASQMNCRYNQYGCTQVWTLPRSIAQHHETYCEYNPFLCPVAKCIIKCSHTTLPLHLAEEHHVRTVVHNEITATGFTMEFSDQIVMVNDDDGKDIYLVHREIHEILGDVFSAPTSSIAKRHTISKFNINLCKESLLLTP